VQNDPQEVGEVRLSLRADSALEWLALRARLVPAPAAEAWGGMALAGVLVAAARVGLTDRLAAGPATVDGLCAELGLEPAATELLLNCLCSGGYVTAGRHGFELSRGARRWLDPSSPVSVARYVASASDYWQWWRELPEVVHGAIPDQQHTADPGDPYWRRYMYGQRDLARLSADEVARKVRVRKPRTMLDLGGGHGWYAARLCRRHPGLSATVLDLPGSAAIGREIIADAGLSDRVRHRDGDVRTADLGAEYDLVCCFNVVHHLAEEEIVDLFRRVRGALAPGGVFAVLDAFVPTGRRAAAIDILAMFVYLSSGARLHSGARLNNWLRDAGFQTPPRSTAVRRIPGLALYQATPV
jgi:ubiquinone/menaquinone biosynthesis C-methylase UbiE